MTDDDDIPDFLRVTPEDQVRRDKARASAPPPTSRFIDPKLEVSRAMAAQQKKEQTQQRIVRMKASLAKKLPKEDTEGKVWNTNTSRWENTQETRMQKERIAEYNRLAAILGEKQLTIKKFESAAIGEARIKKLQERVDAMPKTVQPTESIATPASATQTVETSVAKKAAKKKVAKKASAKEPGGKGKIILDLLKRKSGATVEEAKKATGWDQVHFSAHAKKAGITLRKERDKDGVNHYFAA